MKTWIKAVIFLTASYVFLMYSPFLLDIEPKAYSLTFRDFQGPLEVNHELSKAEHLFTNELTGPESMVFHEGYMYTGISDGRIVKVKDNKIVTVAKTGTDCEMPYEEQKCGRPLGIRMGKDGLMYVIDAYYGIFTLNVTTGELTCILPITTKVDGQQLTFPDDLDLDDDGNIYFSDASSKWSLTNIVYLMFEYEAGGRIIKFNKNTGKTEVLISNLHFANGVQLSKDKKSLLICELMSRRILRYYLKGAKKGQMEVFADSLPGEPDNIRLGSRGYWVGFPSARNSTNPLIADKITTYTVAKRMLARLFNGIATLFVKFSQLTSHPVLKEKSHKFLRGDYILHMLPRHGIVLEFDENGNILRSLQSPDAKTYDLSEVQEHNGYLYLGSFLNNYLGRLKL